MCACVVACLWGEQLWELFLPFHCVGHGDQTHISRLGAKPRYLLGHFTCPTCFLRHLEFKLHQLKKPEANPKTKAWVTSASRGAGDTGREMGRDERKKSSRSVWDVQKLPRNHLSEEYGSGVFTQQCPVSSQEEGPVPGGTNGKLTGSATASTFEPSDSFSLRAGSWLGETVTHPCDFSLASWGAPMIHNQIKI